MYISVLEKHTSAFDSLTSSCAGSHAVTSPKRSLVFPVNFFQTESPFFNPVDPDVLVGLWEGVGGEEEVRNSKTSINGCSFVMSFENEVVLAVFHKHMHYIKYKPMHFIQAHLNIRGEPA